MIVWYRDAKRRGLLPEPPFHITGVGGNGYGFYDMVERAIEKGPLDEHALTASVGDWLRGLKQLSEVPW